MAKAFLPFQRVGEVSPPIRTQYGYIILRLEDEKTRESFRRFGRKYQVAES